MVHICELNTGLLCGDQDKMLECVPTLEFVTIFEELMKGLLLRAIGGFLNSQEPRGEREYAYIPMCDQDKYMIMMILLHVEPPSVWLADTHGGVPLTVGGAGEAGKHRFLYMSRGPSHY